MGACGITARPTWSGSARWRDEWEGWSPERPATGVKGELSHNVECILQ